MRLGILLLNALVWGIVVAAFVIGFKAVKGLFERWSSNRKLKAQYGENWKAHKPEGFITRMKNRFIKRFQKPQDPYKIYEQTTTNQPATTPAPSYTMPGQVTAAIYSFPTVNGPVQTAWSMDQSRKTAKWFGRNLRYWEVPDDYIYNHPAVHGEPGVGLNASNFSSTAIHKGQVGEMNLAKMMAKTGMLNSGVQSLWSLKLPNSNYDTDVDCIITYGNTVYLIDAKNYSVGNANNGTEGMYMLKTGTDNTLVRVNSNGIIPNSEHAISQSMVMAAERYAQYLPAGVNVIPVIVLCPDRNGTPAVKRGTSVVSGKIPVMESTAFLEALQKETQGAEANPQLVDMLRPLIKDAHARTVDAAKPSTLPAEFKNAWSVSTPVQATVVEPVRTPTPNVEPARVNEPAREFNSTTKTYTVPPVSTNPTPVSNSNSTLTGRSQEPVIDWSNSTPSKPLSFGGHHKPAAFQSEGVNGQAAQGVPFVSYKN